MDVFTTIGVQCEFYARLMFPMIPQIPWLRLILCNVLTTEREVHHLLKTVDFGYQKATKRLNIRYKVGKDTLRKLCKPIIRPIMEYADVLWDDCTDFIFPRKAKQYLLRKQL